MRVAFLPSSISNKIQPRKLSLSFQGYAIEYMGSEGSLKLLAKVPTSCEILVARQIDSTWQPFSPGSASHYFLSSRA